MNFTTAKMEYIWLDGSNPQKLRSKTKIVRDFDNQKDFLSQLSLWSCDGSSCELSSTTSSDCLLKPVFVTNDSSRINGYLVLCEVLNPDETPHKTNARALIEDDSDEYWFGVEVEYFIYSKETNKPLGFPKDGLPPPQNQYYCGVGAENIFGRNIVEEHLDDCIYSGLNIEGINAEVAPSQWEAQIFAKGAKAIGDQLWVAKFLLERIAEKYNCYINWHPKPLGDLSFNGSGSHYNLSNEILRTCGSKEIFEKTCEAFRPVVKEHMDLYGAFNELRLTGKYETASFDQFSWGISDRGASIRIPIATVKNGWKGYLEDRRPNSLADPYKVANRIIKTLKSVNYK